MLLNLILVISTVIMVVIFFDANDLDYDREDYGKNIFDDNHNENVFIFHNNQFHQNHIIFIAIIMIRLWK